MIRTTRTAAAALAALALTATLGACGSDGDGDGDGKAGEKPSEKKAARQQPVPPPSAAELGKAMLTAEEVPASLKKTFTQVSKARPPKGHSAATPTRCQPVLDLVSDEPDEKAAASVRHKVQSENLSDSVGITLASYRDAEGAEAALKRIGAAGDECRGGFKSVNKKAGYRDHYTRVTTKRASSGGDAALAFDVAGVATDGSGGTYAFHLALVRTGDTLATFSRYSDDKIPGSGPLPAELVTAQLDKLKSAQKGR